MVAIIFFCIDHVRQYNANYNYFDGMSDAQVSAFQKDAATGHRPTWKTGADALNHGTTKGARSADPDSLGERKVNDPHVFFCLSRQASKQVQRRSRGDMYARSSVSRLRH